MRRLVEGRFGLCGQNKQMRGTGFARGSRFRRSLEDDTRVRSAHTGGHHSRSCGTVTAPFAQLRVDVERGIRKIDFGIAFREVETRRQSPMLEGKDRLYDA